MAPAEEAAGHPEKADAVLKTAGTFVDCYRFRADYLLAAVTGQPHRKPMQTPSPSLNMTISMARFRSSKNRTSKARTGPIL